MVKLTTVHQLNAESVQKPIVAVFVGGSGISQYVLKALATTVSENKGKPFRAYLVGRKPDAAKDVIAECGKLSPESSVTFVQVNDLALMKNVDEVCARIQETEAMYEDGRIDYLLLSPGAVIFQARDDTPEGLDRTMALMYYARIRMILQLKPLLLQSSFPATVVSVYAGGHEEKLIADDISLRKPENYKYAQARSHVVYMYTLFFEHLARENSGKLSLSHVFPGLVTGPGFYNPQLPLVFRLFWRYFFVPLLSGFVCVPHAECGARMLSLLSAKYPAASDGEPVQDAIKSTNGKLGGGSYALGWDGEDTFKPEKYADKDKDALEKLMYSHTTNALDTIASGKVFTE